MSMKLIYTLAFVAIVVTLIFSVTIIEERKQEAIKYQADLEYKSAQEEQRLTEIIEEMRLEEAQIQRDNLFECLDKAETAYFEYAKLNGSTNSEGVITARTSVWDTAEKNRGTAEDRCFKLHN